MTGHRIILWLPTSLWRAQLSGLLSDVCVLGWCFMFCFAGWCVDFLTSKDHLIASVNKAEQFKPSGQQVHEYRHSDGVDYRVYRVSWIVCILFASWKWPRFWHFLYLHHIAAYCPTDPLSYEPTDNFQLSLSRIITINNRQVFVKFLFSWYLSRLNSKSKKTDSMALPHQLCQPNSRHHRR